MWVSRGPMPAVAPRYTPDAPSRVLSDARDIVALARVKGLVTGGGVLHKSVIDNRKDNPTTGHEL